MKTLSKTALKVASRWLFGKNTKQPQFNEDVSWEGFWRSVYNNGKKRVRNPDRETQKRWPDIAASTALKHFDFRIQVEREYERWRSVHVKNYEDQIAKKTGIKIDLDSKHGDETFSLLRKSAKRLKMPVHDFVIHVLKASGLGGLKRSETKNLKVWLSSESPEIHCRVEGGPIKEMLRFYDLHKNEVSNELLWLKKNAPPGTGTRILASQVQEGRRFKIKKITCFAGGEGLWDSVRSGSAQEMVGYYVWPLLGYSRSIYKDEFDPSDIKKDLEYHLDDLPKRRSKHRTQLEELLKLAEKLERRKLFSKKDYIDISEIMRYPEGRELWKWFGFEGYMDFPLNSGSLSLKVLKKYLKKKKINMRISSTNNKTPKTTDAGVSIEKLLLEDVPLLESIWDSIEEENSHEEPKEASKT